VEFNTHLPLLKLDLLADLKSTRLTVQDEYISALSNRRKEKERVAESALSESAPQGRCKNI
jgi:hypothetical protein